MGYLIRTTRRRLTRFLIAGTLVGIGTPLLLGAGNAQASPCSGPEAAGTPCSITATFGLTSGTMTLTPPPALGWTTAVTGLDQSLVDPTGADQTYQVNDATGTAPGWHVTTSATQFTSTTPAATLANTGTFSTNGSLSLATAATAPTTACATTSTCTLPTNTTTYPVDFTTGGTGVPVNIYDASATTGQGTINISSVGWWLNVPSNALAATYTSTITLELISGP